VTRTTDLLDLSPCGLNPIDLDEALRSPERARMVQLDKADKRILELRRVYKIDLGAVAPPPWIAKLRHLRSIVCMADITKLPPALLALPKLRFLHLDESGLTTLDGLEKLRALDTLTIGGTPAADNPAHLASVAKKIKGAKVGGLPGIEVARRPAKVPKAKATLAKLIAADEIDDQADLQGVDLAGATFEDLYVSYDLRRAKLAGTTWRRCDFQFARLAGADLTGATFEDCYFSSVYDGSGNLGKVKAAGASFEHCGGALQLAGADLTNAKLDLEADTSVQLDKAKAAGLELRVAFCSEKEHMISANGADLRRARVDFDVTPDRRAEIAKKKTSRFAWKTDHLKGAKTDKATQIVYANLGAKQAKSVVDEKGPSAKPLGKLYAANASLWMLAIDAAEAAAWGGSDDGGARDDFERALKIESGAIAVGAAKGVLARIGYNGWSYVWEIDRGIALVDCSMQIEDRAAAARALALRVAQWTPKSVKKIGKVAVKSGTLALMLPYRDGTFTPAQLTKARTAIVEDEDRDRILVPLPNGTYDIVWHVFGPRPEYEDEVGSYHTCVRIVRAT
jgi:uncharacterized protein YjbI with pentapeptide repeats